MSYNVHPPLLFLSSSVLSILYGPPLDYKSHLTGPFGGTLPLKSYLDTSFIPLISIPVVPIPTKLVSFVVHVSGLGPRLHPRNPLSFLQSYSLYLSDSSPLILLHSILSISLPSWTLEHPVSFLKPKRHLV